MEYLTKSILQLAYEIIIVYQKYYLYTILYKNNVTTFIVGFLPSTKHGYKSLQYTIS